MMTNWKDTKDQIRSAEKVGDLVGHQIWNPIWDQIFSQAERHLRVQTYMTINWGNINEN